MFQQQDGVYHPVVSDVMQEEENVGESTTTVTTALGGGDNVDIRNTDEEGVVLIEDQQPGSEDVMVAVVRTQQERKCSTCCILVGVSASWLGILHVIEMMNLGIVALGVESSQDDDYPSSYNDDIFPNYNDKNNNTAQFPHENFKHDSWTPANSFDLVISVVGFATSILGCVIVCCLSKVSLSMVYLILLIVDGVAWLIFNYTTTYQAEKVFAAEYASVPPTNLDLEEQAAVVMIVPIIACVVCHCLPAVLYHRQLRRDQNEVVVGEELEELEVN